MAKTTPSFQIYLIFTTMARHCTLWHIVTTSPQGIKKPVSDTDSTKIGTHETGHTPKTAATI
ncbi:MAG: hypothetical protein II661_00520 [Bacteroidales bacterium]|nr:hypothetical protein [Bacteroidales bacterium]